MKKKNTFEDLKTLLTSVLMGFIWGVASLTNLMNRKRWVRE